MKEKIFLRLAALLSVKSIATVALTAGFLHGFVRGSVSAQEFVTVYSVVVAFYFGTQSQKAQGAVEGAP